MCVVVRRIEKKKVVSKQWQLSLVSLNLYECCHRGLSFPYDVALVPTKAATLKLKHGIFTGHQQNHKAGA